MLTLKEGLAVLQTPPEEIPALLAETQKVRLRNVGAKISLCGIMNVKSGACTENCAFCAQSAHHPAAGAAVRPLDLSPLTKYSADRLPIHRLGLVTSGGRLEKAEVARMAEAIREFRRNSETPRVCASLGYLAREELQELKDAGMSRYHHNLETAESFFPRVCTTHTYRRRVETVLAAKDTGLEVCCGGIFGLGETVEQRVEFARQVAALEVEDIPLNFLVPISGTRMESRPPVTPLDILRVTALFRLACPKSGVRVCAGRAVMGPMQSMLFYAGASGMMIGDLLTTVGGVPADDLRMLEELGIPV